jgi:hypothetical protein
MATTHLPWAMFQSQVDTLQKEVGLLFANKMHHHCILRNASKTACIQWAACLGKAHPPVTFETAFPKHHTLPFHDKVVLIIIPPSAIGTLGGGYDGHQDCNANGGGGVRALSTLLPPLLAISPQDLQ